MILSRWSMSWWMATQWFKDKEAASILKYSDTAKAARMHVDDADKLKLEDLQKNGMHFNQPGQTVSPDLG